MAAAACGGETPVRLRLLFDYPPPGTPACGLCWLLLEPSQVRLVTDLISLIRDKFGFSRHTQLSLFLDGALLPPTESARLVRDNDSLRVKLEEVFREDNYNKFANGFSNLSKKQRKQHWQKLEAKESESKDGKYRKRKKKQNVEHLYSQEEISTNIEDSATLRKRKKAVTEREYTADSKNDDSTSNYKKLKKQADKEKEQEAERDKKKTKTRALEMNTSQKTNKILSPRQKSTTEHTIASSSTKKDGTSSDSSASSYDSDHSITGAKQKPTPKTEVASQHINKSQLASIKSVSAGKLAAKCKDKNSLEKTKSKMVRSQSSSSDSDSSSGELGEQQSSNLKNKLPHNNQETVTGLTSKTKPKTSSSESDSSQSETCPIKKPKTNAIVSQSFGENGGKQLPAGTYGPTTNLSDSRRGRGRGEYPFWRGPRVRGCRGMIRGRGRGRGENTHYFYNYNSEHQKQQQLNETATNTSIIIQNPLDAPKKDYSILPLLAAPPQVGEKIAFKEGKIVSWNPANKQLELEILSFSSVTKEPGKFDLVYQSADGAETIEYAVSQDRKITQSWDALIEPRLIVEPPSSEPSTKNENPSDVNLLVPCVNSL